VRHELAAPFRVFGTAARTEVFLPPPVLPG
jgi:hypothetical protein